MASFSPPRSRDNADMATSAARRIRVVLLQTRSEAAGAQEISRILGQQLENDGYEVHHVFLYRRTDAFDRQVNTSFCAHERPVSPTQFARLYATLVRKLRALRPDALLCFQHFGNIIGGLAGRQAGVPLIIANRTTARQNISAPVRIAETGLGLAGIFDKLVVNSQTIEDEYRSYPQWFRSRIRRIDHGFAPKTSTLDRTAARKHFGFSSEVVLLGCVARLHDMKNLATAIHLLPYDPAWHLALAGQGPERTNLERLAAELGVTDRLHFLGELLPENVATLLRALDVFVFPSLAETFGLAVVEAAQAGVPVVANDLPVLREVLEVDGQACATFTDVSDTDSFALTVRRILSDTSLSARLREAGQRLDQRYSVQSMSRQYEDAIEDILSHRQKGSSVRMSRA